MGSGDIRLGNRLIWVHFAWVETGRVDQIACLSNSYSSFTNNWYQILYFDNTPIALIKSFKRFFAFKGAWAGIDPFPIKILSLIFIVPSTPFRDET